MKKNNKSIRWQIFINLTLLIIILLAILWCFQVVFMNQFYKAIRKSEVIKVGQTVAKNIDNPNLLDILLNLSKSKDVSIVVTDEYGQVGYSTQTQLSNHILLNLSSMQYYYLGMLAKERGGEFIYWDNEKEWENPLNAQNTFNYRNYIGLRNKQEDAVIFTKVTKSAGREYIILVNTFVMPVTATVSTIRKQLIYVTIIMLLIAFILSFIIAKKISRPIITINEISKRLASPDLNQNELNFPKTGYKEVIELSNTLTYVSKELVKTEDLRRELIANVSHDLRTPLTLICGYAEMMRDLPGENTPQNNQVIIDEAKRLTALVNDMLDLSKLQAQTMQIESAVYSITQNIQDMMNRYNALIEQNQCQIEFIYDKEVFVKADELKISQVLYNLINNAINYTGNDKKVEVVQKIVDNRVRIEVIDTGEGISEEELPYIWDRYYKVDKSHKRASIGTGLGLSIARNILMAHHAKYGVESKVGKGSTFWFELETNK